MKKHNYFIDFLVYAILSIVLLITLIPVVYTIASAFKSNSEILTHPENMFPINPTFENFKSIWTSDRLNIGRMLFNSIYYTAISVLITLTTSSLSAYVFARHDFKGKKVIFTIFSSLMFISVGSITIYPQFEVLGLLGLADSLNGLLVMKLFGCGIVNIYLVRSYINTLPKELDEAATIDGCGFMGTFFRIILPLLKPILATVGLLAFNGSWNDYLMPTLFTMSRPEQQTLIVGLVSLKSTGEAASAWNLMMAGITITFIPVLLAYSVFNKFFINGITSGAVKG